MNAGQSSDYSRPGIRASFAIRRVDLEIRFRQIIALEKIAETLPGLLPRQDLDRTACAVPLVEAMDGKPADAKPAG